MTQNSTTPYRGFAFNPDGDWGFTTPGRVRRRIIRVSSRKGLPLSTEAVDAWDDSSGAGVSFGLAETTLNPRDYDSFAVVVGSWRMLERITLQEDRPRCLVVRKINSPNNTFHVLADKSTSDGLCSLSAAPGLMACRHSFAFYDEWAGSEKESAPGLIHTAIKRNLNAFCQQSLEKFRSSIVTPPVLSKELVTPVSKETRIHSKGHPAQQTVTNLAEKQSQAEKRPSTIATQTTKEASRLPLEPQEQSKDASDSIPISPPLQTTLGHAETGQQSEDEASSNTSHIELATAALQNLVRIVQNSKGCQTLQESPLQNSKGCQTLQELSLQSGPSEWTKMNTCLARLFTVDAEYTPTNALELLGEMKETTQQFARSASLRTNLVCNALPDSQFESQKDSELSQRNGLGLAKGCIERTIRSANLAVANLDAFLPGHGSTNDMSSGLVYALDKLQEQLPAVTDEFSIEMRNNILSLAHCAQVDGAMRIREVRDVVMAIKAALETLLQNLDVVEQSINLSASRSDDESEGTVDKEENCDMELDETMEDMLNAACL
ncbi:hypothetical protein MY3957_000250 [Beauveria namnaoensis]